MRLQTEVSSKVAEYLDDFCVANACSNSCALRWAVVKMLAEWQSCENGIAIQYQKWLKELTDAEKKERDKTGDGDSGGVGGASLAT